MKDPLSDGSVQASTDVAGETAIVDTITTFNKVTIMEEMHEPTSVDELLKMAGSSDVKNLDFLKSMRLFFEKFAQGLKDGGPEVSYPLLIRFCESPETLTADEIALIENAICTWRRWLLAWIDLLRELQLQRMEHVDGEFNPVGMVQLADQVRMLLQDGPNPSQQDQS